MRKITFAKRLKYRFDNSLSGGTASLIGWLAAITLAIILVTATILVVTGLKPEEEAAADEPVAVAESIADDDKSLSDEVIDQVNKAKDDVVATETPKEPEPYSFPEAMWQSLMHSIDAGTVAGDSGWKYRG